MNKSDKDDMMS